MTPIRAYILLLLLLLAVSNSYAKSTVKRDTGYNEQEAKMLLNLAAGAYADDEQLSDCVNGVQSGNHQVLSVHKEDCDKLNNPCEGYIVANDDYRILYLVFRGTKTDSQLLLQGWSTLQPGVEFYGMGTVNRYFENGHQILWPEIERVLTNETYSQYSITITGHSLGGALASLAAARIATQGYRMSNQIRLVTFGQPRTGSAQYAFNFDRLVPQSYRVVFRKDIVPHIPPCAKETSGDTRLSAKESLACEPLVMDKAYHHGTEIWYPDSMEPNSQYIQCTGLPKNEDFSCSDQFKFDLGKANDYIWDHRHYFDVRVPEFGKTGCDISLPEGEIELKFEKPKLFGVFG